MMNAEPSIYLAFRQACEDIKRLPVRPPDTVLLQLYGLYKQATVGDNTSSTPWPWDVRGKSKWEAWNEQRGKVKETAQKDYVDLVEDLKTRYVNHV